MSKFTHCAALMLAIIISTSCMVQLPGLGELEGRCGDGVTGVGEACDDGNDLNEDTCTNQCETARCGDSFVQGEEACDDGNINDRDACTNACAAAACGDGIWRRDLLFVDDPGFERCDDGNTDDNDDCTSLCAPARCGDGIQQIDEACDDGNSVETDACLNACLVARCGDGVVHQGQEQCDGSEDCSDECLLMNCGNGVIEGSEECDDGNDSINDACANCRTARCGDGWARSDLAPGEDGYEACDDGNQEPGDECSVECLVDDHGNSISVATQVTIPAGRLETYFEQLIQGQINHFSDHDIFAFRTSKTGVYRFDVDGLNQGNPACSVYDDLLDFAGYNDDRSDDDQGCSVDIFVRAERAVYLQVTTINNRTYDYHVNVQMPCGNGLVDAGEECDPAAPGSNVFRCRKDCRNRRTIALAGHTGCAVINRSVRCWGSNSSLIFGRDFNSGASCLQRQVDYYGQHHDLDVPISRRPVEIIPSAMQIKDLSGGWSEGICALSDIDGVQYCWGRQVSDYTVPDEEGLYNRDATSHCADDPNVEYVPSPGWVSICPCMPQPLPYAYYLTDELPQTYNSIGITMGAFNKCIVHDDEGRGIVSCWGARINGMSGFGIFTPDPHPGSVDPGIREPREIRMPGDAPAEYISIGTETACAILSNGRVACWGKNDFGQAGTERRVREPGCLAEACEMIPRLIRSIGRVVSLSVGGDHVCAVNEEGHLYCWGKNDRAQTGLQSDAQPCTADRIACARKPQRVINMPMMIDVAAGRTHTCSLSLAGQVQCWGDNTRGQLGSGSVGPVRPGGANFSRLPVTVGRLGKSLGLTAGEYSNCSRSETGQIYCWGDNAQGQLGDGNCTAAEPSPIQVDLR